MAKALAEAAAKSPLLTEAVARGRISNQASPPAKGKARGQRMSSSLSPDTSYFFESNKKAKIILSSLS
jgi:hypothetical protein